MPPPRRRPPIAGTRRPKVAGRAVTPPKDTEEPDDTTSVESSSVDLSKPDAAVPDVAEPDAGTPDVAPDPAAPDATAPDPTDDADTTAAAPVRGISTRTIVLAGLALVFAVIALVAVIRPGTTEVSNQAWVDNEATSEVTSAARDALQTVFSYKFDTIDDDQAAARELLTEDRLAEYDSTAEQTKEGVIQTQTVTTATVTDIGVVTLEGDRAEVLASLDISAMQDAVDQGTVQTPVAIVMERIDGTWKLAEIDNR